MASQLDPPAEGQHTGSCERPSTTAKGNETIASRLSKKARGSACNKRPEFPMKGSTRSPRPEKSKHRDRRQTRQDSSAYSEVSSASDIDEDFSASSESSDAGNFSSDTETDYQRRGSRHSSHRYNHGYAARSHSRTLLPPGHQSRAGMGIEVEHLSGTEGNVTQSTNPGVNGATLQQDLVAAINALETRCAQLQFQLDRINGPPALPFNGQNQNPASSHSNPYWQRPMAFPQNNSSIAQTCAPRESGQRRLRSRSRPHHRKTNGPPGPRVFVVNNDSTKTSRKADKLLQYKRVDSVWDSRLFAFKLQDSVEVSANSKYDKYVFHVRRNFDSEGKHRSTFVDIKSKLLRECLQDVIGNVRGVNLIDETPKLDPNLLFLYLDDLRSHKKELKKVEPAGQGKRERRRNQLRLDNKRMHLRVLIRYLDKDYAKVKESLYSMLDSGIITFDYLWALWKPNTLVYSELYGFPDDPKIFKVSMSGRQSSIFRGTFYYIDGKYLEFDGKKFGYGTVSEVIPEFQGTRKITSLPLYPLSYHKDETKLRQNLIQRGKKFVSLCGAHYKAYSGIAYLKNKKDSVTKFHIQQSRIMVDPATFRRINPNYFVSPVRPKDYDAVSNSSEPSDEEDVHEYTSSDDARGGGGQKVASKLMKELDPRVDITRTQELDLGDGSNSRLFEALPGRDTTTIQEATSTESSGEEKASPTPEEGASELCLEFIDEDYLIASPVVLGFAFSEKQWLEFSVTRVIEIKWNEDAWESLVLPQETKDLVKALVRSRRHHAARTIDDVIQGKGKGLVTVLHGPPGTGKTLTAEGISELLRCPLYMASAGELGTDSRYLEADLQKILDICHAWGAILLLDEADVFLEKRNMQDIHRNALVSIFLRHLEYFQGILFLTTNRVETFDEAFQSRIHIALRYEGLDAKAKKAIFKLFIERVEAYGKLGVEPFTDNDLDVLAKHELNGREIKNTIGSAQDLAMNKGESLGMKHIQQVLGIHDKFGRDLRGGSGYEDAMRSYF